MFSILLALQLFFSSGQFLTKYNTMCRYDNITTFINDCEETTGKYTFIFNTNGTSDVVLYADGDPKYITNTGMRERGHIMDDGTTSEIIGCEDWDEEPCTLQHGTDFTRLRYPHRSLNVYFYNR